MKPYLNFLTFVLCSFTFVNAQGQQSKIDLLKQLDKIRVDNGISATVVIVVGKDKTLINSHLGHPSWDNQDSWKDKSMFRIGSISKSFAALLALRMQQAGVIDLRNKLIDYLPQTTGNTPIFENTYTHANITLEQLLEHTAGLLDLTQKEWNYNDAKTIGLQQAFAKNLGKHKTYWQPGMHSSYSNVGVGLLGLALEKAGKQSYENLMQKYVFDPLHMNNTSLLLNDNISEKLIAGYNTDGKTPIPYWHNIYRPFAAINTDSSDVIKFVQMLLKQGTFKHKTYLSKSLIQRMETPVSTLAAKAGLEYGYGLANYTWQYHGYTFHGHGGDADGYLSRFGYNKETQMGYFIVINAFNGSALIAMRHLVENYITQNLPKPHYPLRLNLGKNILNDYVGKYAAVTSRFGRINLNKTVLEVINKNNQLYIKYHSNNPHIIFAVTKQQFRYEDESIATMAFIKYKGQLFFQSDLGNFKKL